MEVAGARGLQYHPRRMHRASRTSRLGAGFLPALALLLLAPALRAEAPLPAGVRRGPVPAWVAPHPFDLESPVDPSQAEEGVIILLRDTRIHVASAGVEHYHRVVRKATSQAGVEALAEIQIDFEPDYQRLTLHEVRITREGKAIDALPGASIRLIQKENDLERRVYQGTVTAYVVLSDVRAGDAIDFSYSTTGDNPVLEGRFATAFSLGTWAPARAIHAEVVSDPARTAPLLWRAHEGAPAAPLPGTDPQVLRWSRADVLPEPHEDRVPGWYRGPYVEVSDTGTWADVVAWGLRRYALPAPAEAVRAQIEEIQRATPDRDARALRAIRFVQDEIRYLAISIGPHSHVPHPPAQVLAQRFGDCKDKTLLLVALLRELGLDAAPALVHTGLRGHVAGLLPSARAFDHVLVHLSIDGRERWIDPTWSHQGGSLWTQVEPSVGAALVLRPETRDIVVIPERRLAAPEQEIQKEYTHEPDGSSHLTVTTRYLGEDADDFRQALTRSSRSVIEQRLLNYWAKEHPGARSVAPLAIRDDRDGDVVEMVERYSIPDLWNGESWRAYGDSVGDALQAPRIVARKLPLAFGHPRWVREEQRVMIAGGHGVEDESLQIEDGAFAYSRRVTVLDTHVSVVHDYRSRAGEVEPGAVSRHIARIAETHDALSFTVPAGEGRRPVAGSRGRRRAPLGPVFWGALGVAALIAAIAGVWRARHFWRRRVFRRKRLGGAGDLAANPLRARTTAEALARSRDGKCACGRRFGEGADGVEWSELRLGGEQIHVMRLRCGGCGAQSSRYVRLDEAPS